MAPSTAARDAASKDLGCHAFVPPKSCTDQYELLQALEVKAEGGRTGFCLAPLHVGLSKSTLEGTTSEEKIEELLKLAETATSNTPESSYQDIEKHIGGHGNIMSYLLPGSTSLELTNDNDYVVAWHDVKGKKIEATVTNMGIIDDLFLDFCNNSRAIVSQFQKAGTLFFGTVHMGVAVVIGNFVGSLFVQDAKEFHATTSVSASTADGRVEVANLQVGFDASAKRQVFGRGTIGVHVQFYHLKKTRQNPTIRIKESFPIFSNEDSRLAYLLGTWSAKLRRKLEPKEPGSESSGSTGVARGVAMQEDYPIGGNFRADLEELIQQVDRDVSMQMIPQPSQQPSHAASLREMRDSGTQELHEEDKKDPGREYQRSNNVMYYAPLETMENISREIDTIGTITIGGRVFNAIKPAIQVEFTDSLPIAYREELSGTSEGEEIPGYVLRGDNSGDLFTLWEVSGLESNNGSIVTTHQEDWCVRETIEYVDQGNHERIRELEAVGFARLHQDEADSDEVDVSDVTSGKLVIMGRQILTKTGFDPHESDDGSVGDLDQGQSLAGAASMHRTLDVSDAAAPATTAAPAPAPGIPPTVTASGAGLSPPRKKPKT